MDEKEIAMFKKIGLTAAAALAALTATPVCRNSTIPFVNGSRDAAVNDVPMATGPLTPATPG